MIQKTKNGPYSNLVEKTHEVYDWALRNTAQALA